MPMTGGAAGQDVHTSIPGVVAPMARRCAGPRAGHLRSSRPALRSAADADETANEAQKTAQLPCLVLTSDETRAPHTDSSPGTRPSPWCCTGHAWQPPRAEGSPPPGSVRNSAGAVSTPLTSG